MNPFHLDDEALSAAVDGEMTSDEQVHLDGCSSCRERFDGLRSVALAVGTPVPGRPEAAVEAAIMAALSAAPGRDQPTGPLVLPSPSETVPSPARRSATGPRQAGNAPRRPGHGPGNVPRRRFAELLLATAAVVAVVLGVGALVNGSGRASSTRKSAAIAGPGVALAPSAKSSGAGASASTTLTGPGSASQVPSAASQHAFGGAINGADLGNQTDSAALARIVDARLAVASPNASSPDLSTGVPIPPPCVNQGAAAVGLGGQPVVLRYLAPVRWQGQDAVVLVYDRPAGGLAGVVMRRQGCTTLTTFPL
jgi:hypothetical protein